MAAPTLSAPGVIDITATSARPQVTLTYATGVVATGGTVTDYNDGIDDWKIHTFNVSDDFIVNTAVDVEYLIIAGGGGGGRMPTGAGGGGAGGLLKFINGEAGNTGSAVISLSSGTYPITVGAGGAGGADADHIDGSSGTDSVALSLTAIGGGFGKGSTAPTYPGDGGSGGGHSGGAALVGEPGSVIGQGGLGTPPQGNDGGLGWRQGDGDYFTQRHGGGGGGAGGVGQNAAQLTPGNGGVGKDSSITGLSEGYAGGGGGSSRSTTGSTATHGGGAGGGNVAGTNGTANTGGGGGGGNSANAGAGGSGKVVIRYKV